MMDHTEENLGEYARRVSRRVRIWNLVRRSRDGKTMKQIVRALYPLRPHVAYAHAEFLRENGFFYEEGGKILAYEDIRKLPYRRAFNHQSARF
jgi:hypothetical protein